MAWFGKKKFRDLHSKYKRFVEFVEGFRVLN